MASALCCSTSAPSSIAGAASVSSILPASSSRAACSVSQAFDASASASASAIALAGLRIAPCDRRQRCAVQRSSVRRPVVVVAAAAGAGAGDGGGLEARAPESSVATVAPPVSPKKRGKVAAKPLKSQRVLLRFLWLDKNIGISLDQVVPGHGVIPLSPYFFWPRKDAWEELKAKLESKKWISNKRTIVLLNQATDLINLWQASASNNQF